MKTTMELSDDLYRRVKKKAADESTSVKAIVEQALRLYLGRRAAGKRYRLSWNTESGKLLPGIDLTDRDSLFTAMESDS